MNAQPATETTGPTDWLRSHDLVSDEIRERLTDGVIYEKRPARAPDGSVATGLYNSASEVIREALRLLEERDELRRTRLGSLRKEISVGLDQLEAGEVSEYDDRSLSTIAADIKTKGRTRLAAP